MGITLEFPHPTITVIRRQRYHAWMNAVTFSWLGAREISFICGHKTGDYTNQNGVFKHPKFNHPNQDRDQTWFNPLNCRLHTNQRIPEQSKIVGFNKNSTHLSATAKRRVLIDLRARSILTNLDKCAANFLDEFSSAGDTFPTHAATANAEIAQAICAPSAWKASWKSSRWEWCLPARSGSIAEWTVDIYLEYSNLSEVKNPVYTELHGYIFNGFWDPAINKLKSIRSMAP